MQHEIATVKKTIKRYTTKKVSYTNHLSGFNIRNKNAEFLKLRTRH